MTMSNLPTAQVILFMHSSRLAYNDPRNRGARSNFMPLATWIARGKTYRLSPFPVQWVIRTKRAKLGRPRPQSHRLPYPLSKTHNQVTQANFPDDLAVIIAIKYFNFTRSFPSNLMHMVFGLLNNKRCQTEDILQCGVNSSHVATKRESPCFIVITRSQGQSAV